MPTFGLSASVLPLIPTALSGADDSADFTRIGNPPFTVRWGNHSVTIGNHINFVQVPTLMAVSNDRNEAAWMCSTFLTPILYLPKMLPSALRPLLMINPFADLIALVHGLLFG